jgi:hypothetical protein
MARLSHAVTLLAVSVGITTTGSPAPGGSIRALAEIKQFEFNPGGISGADSVSSASIDGSRINGQAVFGPGFAGYDVFPREGDSAMAGLSKTVDFPDWLYSHNESLADALVELQDALHITGPIDGQIPGNIHFSSDGTLIPNRLFMEEHFDNFGVETVTAAARVIGSLDNPGIPGSSITSQLDLTASRFRPVTDASGSIVLPFHASDTARDISLTFSLDADGRRGGGFDY